VIDRILRIVKLDFSVFKEIEADPNATGQAVIIVVLASFLSALGTWLRADAPRAFVAVFLSSFISGVVGWVVWAIVTHYMGKALYQSGGTLEGMLRVLGYATAPRFLGIFEIIPCFGALAGLAGLILSLIAGIMAISEGLDVSTGQAVIVAVIGWIALFIVTAIIGLILGGAALVTYGLCTAFTR
jgi:hypothetical protein